jgi:putative ABC transport system permease protein
MLDARYRKLWGDVLAERGRIVLMLLSVLVSLGALGAMLGSWRVLACEISRSYASSVPAHATLDLPGGVDARVLQRVREDPRVASAEAREVTLARARVGNEWRPLLLFTVTNFDNQLMNRFTRESGAWPPPIGTLLIERSAIGMAQVGQGESLEVKAPHGRPTRVSISGVVHDAGLAPAWQGRSVYGYVSLETLASLEGNAVLHELRVRFKREPRDAAEADGEGQALAQRLREQGTPVHELRVPPPAQHPHQRQMVTVLLCLVMFAVLSLVLSSILVATSLSALLVRQVREIGVMKAIGAQRWQIARLYALMVAGLGLTAGVLSAPVALLGTNLGVAAISNMLNFEIVESAVPPVVWAVLLTSGVVLPLLCATPVILGATRANVRTALDAYEASSRPALLSLRLPRALRNLLRRPKRLALTLLLLASGGALFITALSVVGAWDANLAKMQTMRHYDLEVRLHEAPPRSLDLSSVPGIATVEWWGQARAAFASAGRVDTVRTYPDRGHGSLTILAPPPDTRLISFPLLAGRWLSQHDTDAVVLNHMAAAQRPGLHIGDQVVLSADGRTANVTVVGIVEEIGSSGVVYLPQETFRAHFGEPRLARLTTRAQTTVDRRRVTTDVELELARVNASVEVVMPFAELRTAVGDHVLILVRALLALAGVIGCVGLLGLSSAIGAAVVERSREIGVMKALGATRSQILQLFLTEGVLTGALGAVFALLLALPLSALVEAGLGQLGFLAPLPFVVSFAAAAGWLGLVFVASLLATWLPARRAATVSVREAIAHV